MTKAPLGGLRSTNEYLGEEIRGRRRKCSRIRSWGMGLAVAGTKGVGILGFLILWLSDVLNR